MIKRNGGVLTLLVSLTVCIAGCQTSRPVTRQAVVRNACDNPLFIEAIELDASSNNCITLSKQGVVKKSSRYRPQEANAIQVKYGDILNVEPAELHNASLYDFIDAWMGVRYKYGGNDTSGIDCSAFVMRLYNEVFGTNVVRTALEQFGQCRIVKDREELREGDLVFFRLRRSKRISHVGIYLANDYFVHASRSQGVMISNLNEPYWKRSYAGAGKIPNGRAEG